MKKTKNIKILTKEVSMNLLDNMRLLEIIYELNDGDAKTEW